MLPYPFKDYDEPKTVAGLNTPICLKGADALQDHTAGDFPGSGAQGDGCTCVGIQRASLTADRVNDAWVAVTHMRHVVLAIQVLAPLRVP